MDTPCKHPVTRFLACTAADRLPGVFVCEVCGEKFTHDINDPHSVHYLNGPNPKASKGVVIIPASSGKG